MKRGYTVLEYKSIIRRLRQVRPDMSMSSDFIVGFPGETEEDFDKLMAMIHEIGYDTSFSFIYSPRPGTPAANLPDDTPRPVGPEDVLPFFRFPASQPPAPPAPGPLPHSSATYHLK